MESTKYLLIGGGVASAEAIKQIRRIDEHGSVTLVSDEPDLPYNRPPLSKEYLRGEEHREKLLFATEAEYGYQGIVPMLSVRAEGLNPADATLSLSNGETLRYEKMLIATGGSPVKLNIPGADKAGVYYLRTIHDADAIATAAKAGKRAVVVGAGFIGLEVAASLTQMGLDVTVLEAMPRVWPRFADESLAAYVQAYCEKRGVAFHTGAEAESFLGDDRITGVRTKSGQEYPCDFACVGVGIRPNIHVAQAGSLALENGIVVDEFMHTSHPNIFAAGDVANYYDPIFDKRRRVEHWGHAEYSGQIAGMNMAGEQTSYNLLSYVWSDIFDLHLEFVGDEDEHDQALVRGSIEQGSFMVLYLKSGLLRAYFSVNTPAKEFPVLQRVIRRKIDVSGVVTNLKDPDYNVRDLLKLAS